MSKSSLCLWMAVVLIAATQVPGWAQDSFQFNFDEGEGLTTTDNTGQYTAVLGANISLPVIDEDSPSGQADDNSVIPYGGFLVDDSEDPVLDVQEGPLTIEAWIKPVALGGYQDLFRIGNSIKAGFTDANFIFTLLGVIDLVPDVTIPLDESWHHVAYVWEPGVGVTFYLDGAEVAFMEETRMPREFENQELSIGSSHTGGDYLQAGLDRFRIHEAVLDADQLDSDAANPAELLDTTLLAYDFNEDDYPFNSSTDADRPTVTLAEEVLEDSLPTFNTDTPTGEEGDYSVYFDGDDVIIYDDNESFALEIVDEPFTFEVWLKFDAAEQTAARPVFLAYGVGGEGGYSFSFRPGGYGVTDSPSGEEGDFAANANGLYADDSVDPILNVQEGPLTFETWIKPESFSGNTDLMRIGDSIKVGFSEANLLFTLLGVVDVNSEVAVPLDDSWHHVAYAWEPGVGVTFYLDGEEVAFVEEDRVGRDFTNQEISIGSAHGGGSRFDGLIDRFRVHEAVLTEDQLDSDASAPSDVLPETLVAYNFDEGNPPYENLTDVVRPAVDAGNTLTVTTYGIVDQHSDAQIPNDGQWHHVAVVLDWDGFAFRYYVDGEEADVIEYTDGVLPVPFNEAYFYMGSERTYNAYGYVGLMDRVKVTRAALEPSEFDYFEPVSVLDWDLY